MLVKKRESLSEALDHPEVGDLFAGTYQFPNHASDPQDCSDQVATRHSLCFSEPEHCYTIFMALGVCPREHERLPIETNVERIARIQPGCPGEPVHLLKPSLQ